MQIFPERTVFDYWGCWHQQIPVGPVINGDFRDSRHLSPLYLSTLPSIVSVKKIYTILPSIFSYTLIYYGHNSAFHHEPLSIVSQKKRGKFRFIMNQHFSNIYTHCTPPTKLFVIHYLVHVILFHYSPHSLELKTKMSTDQWHDLTEHRGKMMKFTYTFQNDIRKQIPGSLIN